MREDTITLYPGNWLYNTGVVGFLNILSFGINEIFIENNLNDNDSLALSRNIFDFDKDLSTPKNSNLLC